MLSETTEALQPPHAGPRILAEVATLRGPLQKFASELRALRVARARSAASILELCELAASCGEGGNLALDGEISSAVTDREVAPEMLQAPGLQSLPCVTTSGAGASPPAESGAPVEQAESHLPHGATAAQADVWAEEVLGRIRGAIERSRRDPREVFFRFCSHGLDVLRSEDLGRVLQAFEPDLPDTLQRRLWHALGKADGDALTLTEFCHLCGPSPALPFHGPKEEDGGDAAAEAATSIVSTGGANESGGPPNPEVNGRRNSVPLDERRARALLYRFGRGIDANDSNVRQELLRPGDSSGLSVQELLEASSRHSIPLSRVEIVALFWRFGGATGSAPRAEFFREALRAASAEPPPEVARARRTLAAASERRGELKGELLSLCREEGAADAAAIRDLLAGYMPLDDAQWESIDLSLAKRPDGAILLPPLLDLAGLAASAPGAPPATPKPRPRAGDLLADSWVPSHRSWGPLPSVREEGEEAATSENSSGSGVEV